MSGSATMGVSKTNHAHVKIQNRAPCTGTDVNRDILNNAFFAHAMTELCAYPQWLWSLAGLRVATCNIEPKWSDWSFNRLSWLLFNHVVH